MESFLEKMAATACTIQNKVDFICTRGWIACYDIASMPQDDEFNVVVQVASMDTTHHGTVNVVHLKLPNEFGEANEVREPRVTGETVRFDATPYQGHVRKGQVFMLVGAKMMREVGGDPCLRFPEIQEMRATIQLPTQTDSIASMVDLFTGGLSNFATAARLLPMEVAMQVDQDGLAISNILLNNNDATLFSGTGDQTTFSLFWGDVLDLRWIQGLIGKNVEIVSASPPADPYVGNNEGLREGKKAMGWLQLFMVLRFLQRRAFILQTVPRVAHHEDLKTLLEIFKWCGYRCVWKGFSDPSRHTPAERQRYCMVFWNTADYPAAGKAFKMMRMPEEHPMACHCTMWHPFW